MRRSLVILLVSMLLAPAAALARDLSSGDGSLQVSGAQARGISVQGCGLIFGHFAQGVLTVVDYNPTGLTAPQISGALPPKVAPNSVRYTGSDVRFLFPTGRYTLRFEGVDIDISAVGKGSISAVGLGTGSDGAITVNGGKAQQLSFNGLSTSFGKSSSCKDAKEKDVKESSSSSGKAASR